MPESRDRFETSVKSRKKCPVCDVDLVMSERQGIEIDYCPECRGVWLDRGELDKIIKHSLQLQGTTGQYPGGQESNEYAPRDDNGDYREDNGYREDRDSGQESGSSQESDSREDDSSRVGNYGSSGHGGGHGSRGGHGSSGHGHGGGQGGGHGRRHGGGLGGSRHGGSRHGGGHGGYGGGHRGRSWLQDLFH